MVNKITKFIFVVISLVFIWTAIIPNFAYAESEKTITSVASETETDTEEDKFGLGNLEDYKKAPNMGVAKNKAQTILGIIRTVGVAVSVIALIALGLKYMLGSLEARAEYKKTLIPYLVGALLVFATSLLPEVIYNLLEDFH